MDELHPIYLGCESRNESNSPTTRWTCHLKPHYLPPLRLGIVFTLRALSTWSASALSASHRCTYAENEVAQPSARRVPSRLHRRQRMPEAAPRCGQPRPPAPAALGRFTAGMATLGLGSRRSAAQLLDALGVSHARVAEDAVVHRERARVLGRRGRPRRLRLGNCLFAAVLLRRISLVRVALTGVGSRRRLAPHHVLLVVVAHLRAVGVA